MTPEALYEHAVTLLARKDYSHGEMRRVLHTMTDDVMTVEAALLRLLESGYIDDRRLAENLLSRFLRKEYGPSRIRMEFRQKGIEQSVAESALADTAADWFAMASESRRKKFGDALPSDPKEKARQMRFLQSRGFTMEMIIEAITPVKD
jgi:regulatory protein